MGRVWGIAPGGLSEPVARLIVGEGGEMGRAPNGVAPRYRDVGYSWELVRHVADRWRGEAPAALLGSHYLGGIAMVGVGIGEHWNTAGCRVPVPVGAGNGCVRELVFGDEDVGGERGGDSVR